jgi:hypothetical protein
MSNTKLTSLMKAAAIVAVLSFDPPYRRAGLTFTERELVIDPATVTEEQVSRLMLDPAITLSARDLPKAPDVDAVAKAEAEARAQVEAEAEAKEKAEVEAKEKAEAEAKASKKKGQDNA